MFAGLVAVFWGMGSFDSVRLAPHFPQDDNLKIDGNVEMNSNLKLNNNLKA
jgi:hypothetical protein